MQINDLAKQMVIDSVRKNLAETHNLCTRAECDDALDSPEFLALVVDGTTNLVTKSLTVLYAIGKYEKGEDFANEFLDAYINHIRSAVISKYAEKEGEFDSENARISDDLSGNLS